jgi:hypothetical protein
MFLEAVDRRDLPGVEGDIRKTYKSRKKVERKKAVVDITGGINGEDRKYGKLRR